MSRLKRGEKLLPSVSPRRWTIWSAPRRMRRFVLATDVVAIITAGVLLSTTHVNIHAWGQLLALLCLSVLFEEVSARVEFLRVRLSVNRHNDMSSVWTFAGAVVLPPAAAIVLAVLIRLHMWLRHQKRSGIQAYRQVFTAVTIIFACLLARVVLTQIGHATGTIPAGVIALVGICAAMLVYTVVNTGLIYCAIRLASPPGDAPSFFSQWQDNALEIATLCLAGLTALAMLYQPWLAVLVLPSMVVLQRSVLTKELEVAATTDSKTGLLNAVTWRQLAERELTRADRDQHPAALLIIDMDNFKLINDTHGHLAGDAVLKAVAGCLTDEMRSYDAVGRFGGEEFVALLSDADVVTARGVANRVLERIRDLEVSTRNSTTSPITGLSASIGVACYPQHGSDVEDLLHAADAALYVAKNAGRNRVEFDAKSL
jgi:diguanylate cyclase (GGDEF)-like protein